MGYCNHQETDQWKVQAGEVKYWLAALNPYPKPPQWTSFTLSTYDFQSFMIIVLEGNPASSLLLEVLPVHTEMWTGCQRSSCLFASLFFLKAPSWYQNLWEVSLKAYPVSCELFGLHSPCGPQWVRRCWRQPWERNSSPKHIVYEPAAPLVCCSKLSEAIDKSLQNTKQVIKNIRISLSKPHRKLTDTNRNFPF